jgi:hypothetical protein
VFIGDSRIRQLYMAFLNHLDPHEDTTATVPPDRHRSDLSFGDSKLCLRVEFIWSPYVSKHMINDFQNWKVRNDIVSLGTVRCQILNAIKLYACMMKVT